MFGHQDDNSEPQDNQENTAVDENQAAPAEGAEAQTEQPDEQAAEPAADAPSDDAPQDTDVPSDDTSGDEHAMSGVDDLVIKSDDENTDDKAPEDVDASNKPVGDDLQPGTPVDDDKDKISDVISPAGGFPKHPGDYPISVGSGGSSPQLDTNDGANEELVGVRKQALTDLSPIVDKLDLPPEDKFRTLMMVIQSNDNQDLIKQAYEAAHSIEDEKARAQALYDIINEINYFTGPHDAEPQSD